MVYFGGEAVKSNRAAWILICSQSISIAGDSLLLIVLPLLVFDLTGSAFEVSVVFILTELPNFFGFFSGVLRRYFSPKQLVILYDAGRFFILLFLTFMEIYGYNSTYIIYCMFFLINIFSTFFRPTRIELITQLVDKSQLKKFNSLDQTFEATAMAIGLGLGGYAYHYLSLEWIFFCNALTFFVSGFVMLMIKSIKSTKDVSENNSKFTLSYFWKMSIQVSKQKQTSFLVFGEALAGGAVGIFIAIFVVYAKQYLQVDSITIGHMEMIQSIFAICTGMLIALNFIRISERSLGVCGYLGMGICMIVIGITTSIPLVYLLMAILGLFNMMYSIAVRTLLQTSVQKEEVIHVFALESILSRSASIVGALVAGSLISLFSITANWVIFYSGLILLIVSLWGYRNLFSKQNVYHIDGNRGEKNV
ncbi:hypothetical protein B2I22_16920 [Bacillus spizizenii]|nr:hypothetical protein B2I22_16920 [Bacillus spizizenii]